MSRHAVGSFDGNTFEPWQAFGGVHVQQATMEFGENETPE
jgi:hypothetical protein